MLDKLTDDLLTLLDEDDERLGRNGETSVGVGWESFAKSKPEGMGTQIDLKQDHTGTILLVRDPDRKVLQGYFCNYQLTPSVVQTWYYGWVQENLEVDLIKPVVDMNDDDGDDSQDDFDSEEVDYDDSYGDEEPEYPQDDIDAEEQYEADKALEQEALQADDHIAPDDDEEDVAKEQHANGD